jgi:neutral ceramidase
MKKSCFLTLIVLLLGQVIGWAQTDEAHPLKVGAAKIDITPADQPVAPATGKYDHERAYIRAIVLDNTDTRAALITIEGRIENAACADLLEELSDELDCPVANIIITTTHSHSVRMDRTTENQPKGVADITMDAVRQARAALQPAKMGYGKGTCYLNVNRDAIDMDTRKWVQAPNLDGWSDKSVDVIKFEKPSGELIAVYMTYAMHPINAFASGVFSADFPGAACRYVEKAFGDDIVMAFSQGASGDQNPKYIRTQLNAIHSRQKTETETPQLSNPGLLPVDQDALDNMFRMIESEGQILGEEVIQVMAMTRKTSSDVYIKGAQKTVSCPGRTRVKYDPADPASREGSPGEYEDGPDVDHHLAILGLGTAVISACDGELFSYIGLQLRKESPLTQTMFVTLTSTGQGRAPGYIPNDAAYGEQTFQVLKARDKQGCAERAIIEGLTELITDYITP